MDPSRDSRYNLNYSMSIGLSMGENPDIYGQTNPALARPPSNLGQTMNRGSGGSLMSTNQQCASMANSRGIKRTSSDCFDDRGGMGSQTLSQLESCTGGVPDVVDDSYTSLQKKSPPANGKKTKGRVKIKMEYIDNKLRRYTTFSKRKTGIMKKVSKITDVITWLFAFTLRVHNFNQSIAHFHWEMKPEKIVQRIAFAKSFTKQSLVYSCYYINVLRYFHTICWLP